MNILDIAIAKKLAGGGGGSGTDNYNDLSNLPKINDTTLSGNKSSSALGLQSEINSDSKLASDLVDDTNQDNKFVTSTEKDTWNGKQNAIDADHKLSSDLVDDANKTNKFVTSTEKNTWNAKQNAIDSDHKLSSDLVDDANKTNKFVTSTEKQTWNNKQNAIDSDHKLSSSLVSFTTAEAAALASGIDSSKVGQISTNQTNILSVLDADGQKNIFTTSEGFSTSAYKGSYTVNGNQITITSTMNWGFVGFKVHVPKANVGYVLLMNVDSKDSTVSAKRVCLCTYPDAAQGAFRYKDITSTGVFALEFTPPTDVTEFNILMYCNNSETTANTSLVVSDVMLLSSILYRVSDTYQPFALPNYDLTRLEAEDRASLAEVVDSGAKNIFEFRSLDDLKALNSTGTWNNNAYTISGVTFTVDTTNKTIATSGTSTAMISFVIDAYSTATTKFAGYVLSGCPTGGNYDTGYYMYTTDASSNTKDKDFGEGCIIGSAAISRIRIGCRSGVNMSSKTFKPMICTKAAFGVSSAFVPYRYDPYTTSRQNVANGTLYAKRNGRTVTINGYVDNVSFTAGSATSLGTINNEIGKPVQQVRAICSIGLNAYTFGEPSYITIGTDGNVVVTPKTYSGTGAVFFSVSYTI